MLYFFLLFSPSRVSPAPARGGADPAETLALLRYLLHHNEHHAEELNELAQRVDDERANLLLHEAVDALKQSNAKLAAALELL